MATPPAYFPANLRTMDLPAALGAKFDVVLVDPPLEEYARHRAVETDSWSWKEISALNVNDVLADSAFVFLWVGSAEGLDAGRDLLAHWGLRRCEEICWVKTNKRTPSSVPVPLEEGAILQHTMEHCVVGVHGPVKRGDQHLVHPNLDVDVIVAEEVGGATRGSNAVQLIQLIQPGR